MAQFSCIFLSEEEKDNLIKDVTYDEIKAGLWSRKAFKAPEADGLHARFFQIFWHEVNESICKEVGSIFSSRVMPEYLNRTLIVLVPKCQNLETINNYRPISLCNTIYKVVTKIIVARIHPLLSNLISPVQAAFVLGRRGLDNVLINQELIYSIDKKKGKVGYMAIKVDLEKAYDRLEWSFIHKVLQGFHFPDQLIKVIMSCISSTSISILFNRGTLESFNPMRGIHQGDPLSPYIFILCIEYLGSLIDKECMEGNWNPIKASRDNIGISHLFFADDLMLFATATEENSETIKEVLELFCTESGQKISTCKSRVYFSQNVDDDFKGRICGNLNIQATNNLGKYLGFPLKNKNAERNQYNFIVKRVINRLARWKSKFLSFAGRTVLVKLVMSAMPNHVMQGVALPSHLYEKLDKHQQRFFMGLLY